MNSNILNIAFVIGLVIIVNKCLSTDIKEGFGTLPPQTVKMQRVAQYPGSAMFEVPGNYQSSLSPRMSGGQNYGAYIRYNTPSVDHMASDPNDPLSIYNSPIKIKENYCGSGQSASGAPSQGHQPSMAQSYTEAVDMLPVNGLGGAAVNALGEQVTQPIIYDRFIYANQKSRKYNQGDPIRGDLPIVPVRNEWFRPSASPNIDLQSGAMAVMGGLNMDTTKEMLALQSAASGGLLDVGSGVNYSIQQSPYTTSAGGDIQVRSFP